jgi:hypothetical protein
MDRHRVVRDIVDPLLLETTPKFVEMEAAYVRVRNVLTLAGQPIALGKSRKSSVPAAAALLICPTYSAYFVELSGTEYRLVTTGR